jgi:hypothetical protein
VQSGDERRRPLTRHERAANPIDGGRHRRKVDRDLVAEPARVLALVVGGADHNRIAVGWTQRHPCHGSAGTIGVAPGEVNARTRLPDVRRNNALE